MSNINSSKQWDPWKMYDMNKADMKAVQERAKRRAALKAEWQQKVTNPYKPTSYIVCVIIHMKQKLTDCLIYSCGIFGLRLQNVFRVITFNHKHRCLLLDLIMFVLSLLLI
jgi:hypothetical protein